MKLTKKGFTLIEMLIVIVIIGILAAALIPRLTGIQARARDTARKADLNQISTALATYNLDNGTYPTSTSWAATTGVLSILSGNMTSVPKEGSAGWMPYQYQTNTGGTVFVLASVSEGGGVNANWSGASASQIANPATVTIGTSPVSACTPGVASCIGTDKAGFRYILSN